MINDFDEYNDYSNQNSEQIISDLNKKAEQGIYERYRYIQNSNYNYSVAATIADFIDGKDIPLYKISRLANILNKIEMNGSCIVSQGKGITIYYYLGEKIVIEIEDVISPGKSRIDKITIMPEKAKWEAYNTTPSNAINLKDDKKYDKKRITYIAKYLGATLNYINDNILDDSKKIVK